MLLLFENCPMNFKTVKKLISCALPACLLLGSGQNLIGSARFLLGSGRFWWVHVISSTQFSYLVSFLVNFTYIVITDTITNFTCSLY